MLTEISDQIKDLLTVILKDFFNGCLETNHLAVKKFLTIFFLYWGSLPKSTIRVPLEVIAVEKCSGLSQMFFFLRFKLSRGMVTATIFWLKFMYLKNC